VQALNRALDAVDRFQQRHKATAIVAACIRSYSDARGSMLAGLTTFYGFLAIFPLLLLFFTIVAVTLKNHPDLQARLITAVLSQFPELGQNLEAQIHTLSANSLSVALLTAIGLAWGGLGVARALTHATTMLWQVPRAEELSFWIRLRREVGVIGVVSATILAGAAATALSTNRVAESVFGSTWLHLGELALSGLINILGYCFALKLLAPKKHTWRTFAPGAILGGLGWTGVLGLGSALLAHHLGSLGALYGVFAVVLGLVFWINLGTQLFLYATTLTVVLETKDWPKSFRRS
jgi:uncharacterized BrkB/YihY/UPF0761 family membrane protein